MGILNKLRRWLFDFSAGQAEGKRIERLFRVALAETTTEAEFNDLCYRMVQEDDYLRTQVRWINVMRQLDPFLGAGETRRIAAERLIAYLPGFYGYESVWKTKPDEPAA